MGICDNIINLRFKRFEEGIEETLKDAKDENYFNDVILACEDNQINAHKIILSSFSPILRNILKQNINPNPYIYFRNTKFVNLENVHKIMYEGEANVDKDDITSFLDLTEYLGLGHFSDIDMFESDIKSPPRKQKFDVKSYGKKLQKNNNAEFNYIKNEDLNSFSKAIGKPSFPRKRGRPKKKLNLIMEPNFIINSENELVNSKEEPDDGNEPINKTEPYVGNEPVKKTEINARNDTEQKLDNNLMDEAEDAKKEVKKKLGRGKDLEWLEFSTFASLDDFNDSGLREDIKNIFSKQKTIESSSHIRDTYICKYLRKKQFKPCPNKFRVSFSYSTDEILVEAVGNIKHEHEKIDNSAEDKSYYDWTEEQTNIIKKVVANNEYRNYGELTTHVMENLEEKNPPGAILPSKTQLYSKLRHQTRRVVCGDGVPSRRVVCGDGFASRRVVCGDGVPSRRRKTIKLRTSRGRNRLGGQELGAP